ncbi:beta-lactamase/transpeptidase-like protein [Xylariaceae sp. FL0255]|nr:beta-lactamase/transpeptidase-like protein [Xylariaceae sp. FL0255]
MEFFRSDEFSARIRDLMDKEHVPGLVVAVVQGDEIESKGYGVANLASSEPVTGSTLFDIASVSKSFTAAAVGLLVADNENYPEVQYTATMSSLLPDDFVMQEKGYTEGVTLEDILSHRSGLPGHDDSYLKSDTPRSVTRNLRNLPVAAPLRSQYMYCNQMYTVATHLIEEKTGQSFSDFLEERIFTPLQMDSTSLQPSRAHEKGHGERIAMGYRWIGPRSTATTSSNPIFPPASSTFASSPNSDPQSSYRPVEVFNDPEAQGAGSILTSADDLIKWVRAFLRHDQDPITEDIYRGLVRMRTIVDPSEMCQKKHTSAEIYAAGLEMYHYRGHAIIGHDGGICGFASRFVFLPELDFGVCLMGNSEGVDKFSCMVCRMLVDVVLGMDESNDDATREKKKKDAKLASHPREVVTKKTTTSQEKLTPKTELSTESNEERREENPKRQLSEPELELPLTAYTGTYHHPGYHDMIVQTKDGRLFIDASDRSMGFTLTFYHVRDGTHFSPNLISILDGEEERIQAEFMQSDEGRVVRLGLDLEPKIKELIWFERFDG